MIVPMVSVGQIGVFRIGGRVPYSFQYVSGLGVWDEELVVALSLVPVPRNAERESIGILLKTPHSTTRWALEIAAPVGLLTVSNVAAPTQTSSMRPSWLLTATASSDRTMMWINVDEMVRAAERGS